MEEKKTPRVRKPKVTEKKTPAAIKPVVKKSAPEPESVVKKIGDALVVTTHFNEKTKFKTESKEKCEECKEKLVKVKWASSDHPDDGDFYGFFCTNDKCDLLNLCQGTIGKAPTGLRFAFKNKKKGVDKEPRQVKEGKEP